MGIEAAANNEFRFLSSDAERVGRERPLPRVARFETGVGGGRRLSGLRFAEEDVAPRLVALHGAGLNAHSFDPMLLALDEPAIALDLPGHGRSDWRPDADYRPDHLADDVVSALETLAPEQVALLGHSLGGLAAALAAAARPELVARLILVDITPGVTPGGGGKSIAEFILGQRDYGTVDEIVDRAIRFGIGSDRSSLTRGVTLNTRRRADGRLEWTHHLAHLDALPTGASDDPFPYAPIWASLQALEVPVSLIAADAGILRPTHIEEWREQLPDSPVVTLAGPHNLHEAVPGELAAAVRDLSA